MTSAPAMTTRWRWPPDSSCGIAAEEVGRRAEPGGLERGHDLRLALGSGCRSVDDQRLGHEVTDRLLRVERLVRVLEDDLDPPPVRQRAGSHRRADVVALEMMRPAGLAGQLDHDAPGRRLAAARLADQGEHLAADRSAGRSRRPPGRPGGAGERDPCHAPTDREVDLEAGQPDDPVLALQQTARVTPAGPTRWPSATARRRDRSSAWAYRAPSLPSG